MHSMEQFFFLFHYKRLSFQNLTWNIVFGNWAFIARSIQTLL